MKRSNLHKAITAKRVLYDTKPGRYADGGGLYLVIDKTGFFRWVLRLVVPARGKRCDIRLGSVNTDSLAHARDAADKRRKLAKVVVVLFFVCLVCCFFVVVFFFLFVVLCVVCLCCLVCFFVFFCVCVLVFCWYYN